MRPPVGLALIWLACTACDVPAVLPDAPAAKPDGFRPPPDAPYDCTLNAPTMPVATIAGCEQHGGIDGDRATARFKNPVHVAVVPNEAALYVADFDNHRVRKLALDGTTQTIIDQSMMPAGVSFMFPFGLATAADGTLYIETDNSPTGAHSSNTGTVWRWKPGATTPTVVLADIGRPRGMVVLRNGTLLLADHMHHVLRLLDPNSKTITIVAGTYNRPGSADGNGLQAAFDQPYHLAQMPDGAVAVTEFGGHRIRQVTLDLTTRRATVSTLAGTGAVGATNGAAASASFNQPQGIVAASDGTLYVTELGNADIRKLQDGQVTTVAGDHTPGFRDSDALSTAQFYGLEGLAISPDGRALYIADGSRGNAGLPYHRVRIVRLPQ